MGVCNLILDVMAPEAHQNDHSYVRKLSKLAVDSLCKDFAWSAVTLWELENLSNWFVQRREIPQPMPFYS